MRRLLWAIPFIIFIQISPIGSLEVTAETSTTTSSSVPPCCDGGTRQWSQPSVVTSGPGVSTNIGTLVVVGEPWYLNVTQYPQQKCNWCGPAVAYSFAKYFGKSFTQTQLATYARAALNPPTWCACAKGDPACLGTEDMAGLLKYATGYSYTPFQYSSAIGSPTALANMAWGSLYYGNRPVAANTFEGYQKLSYNKHTSDGSDYIRAADGIGHYIAITGVTYSTLTILDPAANSTSLGWDLTAASKNIAASSLANYFSGSRGIYK